MNVALAVVPVAYLVGTFPSAVIVARSRGLDITASGSGNPGASNVARVMGTKWGLVVFVLDGLKGAIPAGVGLLLDTRPGAYALVGAAVLGHMYPATRRFQGGKGVATLGGAMLVLHPLPSIGLLATWIAIRKVTGKASLGSLIILLALPVLVAIDRSKAWEVVVVTGLAAVVALRHLGNIRRLVGGSELRASR